MISRLSATFYLAAAAAASVSAFVPPRPATTGSSLGFGFLKELGLEKPSWLPDFGGKKEEAPAEVADDASKETAEVAEETAKEE